LRPWIASRSLSSGAHSRDPLARNDGVYDWLFENGICRKVATAPYPQAIVAREGGRSSIPSRSERVLSLMLAGVGSGSEPAHIEAFRASARRNARDFETLGSPEVAKTYGQSPNRIAFKVKDPRGFAVWRKQIAGRRAILPRGVPEDGVTASVRRVGSIQAVEGCGAMTSPLDALAEAAAYKSWVSGRASCRLQRALPASRRAQISEKALF